ncbi:MAG TPA: dihydrolipoyl dehydrogenase [Nitrososphaeraceae archaeon]|nr:dihydrolipoyl dehydrogenase [Nitrososphaeraceae archaeon]
MEKFDLIVIGSGSGLDVANAAAQKGLKVAIIEKYKLGGTCLNTGCIPSKLLIHSADIIEIIKKANTFGINVKDYSIDFQKIVNRVNKIVDTDANKIKKGLQESKNPHLFLEECRFIEGEKKIALSNNEIVTADKILIASGTRPFIPKIKGLENVEYITSNEALRLKQQPKTLTIIGGGYIACELGHFFGSLGTKINIIQRKDLLIPNEDIDISTKFTEMFSKKYNVYLGYNTEKVSYDSNNNSNNSSEQQKIFNVIAKNKFGDSVKVSSDQLLIATGRIPNSDLLNIKKSGVKINEKGFIVVDEYLETNIEGIFALGDVVGKYQFKHNANNEAQYAYNNIVNPGEKIPVNYTAMPHAIFTNPQIAGVGYTEQELKKEKIPYEKSIYPYIQTGMGQAIEDKEGFVKFLIDKKNRTILGCHIMGTDASILIHEVLVVMRMGTAKEEKEEEVKGKIDNITRTIHIHPALSEVVGRAASAL